jgi:hypothetical protein
MSLFEDTNPRALKELLLEIHNRTTVLPDFQRDFVWEPGATQELIVSIANNYPAGSLLRVRDAQRVFAAREFEGAEPIGSNKHTFLVLDGQQRLTSLYQAFYGVGEHRYFIDLRQLMDGGDFEEAIFHVRATTKWAKSMEDIELQARDLTLPLSVLKGGSGGFTQWSRKVARKLSDAERVKLEDSLDSIEEQWIKVMDDYHFPVVTLSADTEPDALCTIFETLNRTGVKLSVFELLTARFWPRNINLRALWDKALADHPVIADFDVDPYYVLQGISLAGRKAPSCKRNDVLNMEAADIEQWWGPVVDGLAAGLRLLRDDCKVLLPKWLPYQTMLAPLAAVLARVEESTGPEMGVRREKLKQWFWCAVFGQVYESAPNSKAAKDVVEVVPWLSGGSAPESVSTFRFDPRALREVTPRQRSIYRGAICLVLDGAKDFHTLKPITSSLVAAEGIDDHHIFPAAFLQRSGVTVQRVRDCILNRTLIDRKTNQVISDRAPSDYLNEIRQTPGYPFEDLLRSHGLPEEALKQDDFESFLQQRQEFFWQRIQAATKVACESALEDEEALEETAL